MTVGEIKQTISSKYPLLFAARPSFIEGMARVLDLGGTLQIYNQSRSAAEADTEALHSDWIAVGNDLRLAIGEYGKRV